MGTLKKFGKYMLFLILFWILSDILIFVGINSMYKDMKPKVEVPNGVEVVQMQATSVNGRMKIKITDKKLEGKFLKIDLYSARGNNFGTKYLEIGNIETEDGKQVETYFKISEVESYEISVVDEMGTSTEGFMDTALSTLSVLGIVIKFLL